MSKRPNAAIRASRKLYANQYAHLDGEGGYDAIYFQGPLDVHESRRLSGNPYAYLDEVGEFSEYSRATHANQLTPKALQTDFLLGHKRKGDNFSKFDINDIVRKLQNGMWKERKFIWPNKKEISHNDVLDPSVALRLLGYQVDIYDSLGQYSSGSEIFEVAGTIDEHEQQVQISGRFSPVIRNFTIAHELGHAVLHRGQSLHRDRPLDGSSTNSPRNNTETEADMFAAFFLMPETLVKTAFKQLFLTEHFIINDDSAFALGYENATSLEKKCRTLLDLLKVLTRAEQYNGRFFPSLARQFGVSVDAMSIRLEELNLASM